MGFFLMFFSIFLGIAIIFLRLTHWLTLILDIVCLGLAGGYLTYKYIIPDDYISNTKWFWIVLVGIIFIIIYLIIIFILAVGFPLINKIVQFFISILSSALHLGLLKIIFDSMYTEMYLKQKRTIIHFYIFDNPIYDYVIYGIVILFYAVYIYFIRMEIFDDVY